MHAAVLETIKQVKWEWESEIKTSLQLGTSLSGSIADLNLGCVLGWGFRDSFYFDLFWPLTLAAALLIGSWLTCRLSIHA